MIWLDEDDEIDELSEANNHYAENVACGDSNGDVELNAADIIYMVNYVFKGGPAPLGDGDVNGNGSVNAADIIYLVNHVFKGGPAPDCVG